MPDRMLRARCKTGEDIGSFSLLECGAALPNLISVVARVSRINLEPFLGGVRADVRMLTRPFPIVLCHSIEDLTRRLAGRFECLHCGFDRPFRILQFFCELVLVIA